MPAGCGKLVWDYCHLALPLQVMRQNTWTPFYIGTWDPDSLTCSQESEQTYPTHEEADQALKSGNWTQRRRP
ncbi:MAG: hypothetical protein JF606_15225 [Burkholderiales bacterium]|nr:hypothetical protein [Burkholderiales bacterium]